MPANFPQPAPAPRPVRFGPATRNSLSPDDMACQMPDIFCASPRYRNALQAEKLELEARELRELRELRA